MRSPLSVRLAAAIALLGVSLPGAARAQNVWDLGALSGTGGSLGSPFTFTYTGGLLGSITGFSTSSADYLYSKDFGQPLSDTEHGIGLCTVAGCTGGSTGDFEIGDFGSNGIIFDLNLAAGVSLTGFRLSSVQAGENWKTFYMTTGAGTCNTSTDFSSAPFYSGTKNEASDFASQSSTADCFKFVPNGGSGGADYLVQTFTTLGSGTGIETTVPEPASMTLLATGLVGMVGMARRRRK